MTVKLSIAGRRVDVAQSKDPLDDVEVVAAYNLSPAARDRTDAPEPFTAEDDDVLEIEVEGGFRIWTSARRFQDEVLLLRPEAEVGDAVRVDTLPRVSKRGITEWVQNGLRVLRLKRTDLDDIRGNRDLEDLAKLAGDLGIDLAVELPAWFATKVLIRTIEGRLRPKQGLYYWADATRELAPRDEDPKPASFDGYDVEKPMLVFLHGTASSTRGSFGAFLGDDAQPQWQALQQIFDDRIYAFEHRTVSDSPIDNAIELISALPQNARVSLVSHSRGGLVGDLISLTSISTHLVARFDRNDPELRHADDHDRRQLERLARLIAQKQLRIERFVRCAAPSRGTLLASENLDFLMSVLTNLIGLIPGLGGNPLYEVTKRIALEIISNRTRPALLPGIEAMVPGSPLVGLLNNLESPATGALGVVAGDIQGGNWLKRLGVFANDQFLYESRDNDLVVNTDAMFHGARREVSGYVFDQGADVSHFNYFRNPRTRAAVVDWLAAKAGDPLEPFRELKVSDPSPVPMLRSQPNQVGADRPMVFVLPGVMGSHLKVADHEVWLNYSALLRGGLGELADVDATNVQPGGLVGEAYRDLCRALDDSHEVIPFAYDWRRSVTVAAVLLAAEVDGALKRTKQPVRFVAHGVGGLVVRKMITERPDLWDAICARAGARLVMLGTPNRGSYEAVEALLGTSAGTQQLALLDHSRDIADIANIAAGYPGVLELLPTDTRHVGQQCWKDYRALRTESAVPNSERLDAARRAMEALKGASAIPHASCVHYVAGTSGRTVYDVDIKAGRVVLSVTSEGDGRVTYESGQLPGVPTWYMEAVHGDLPSHPAGLPAIKELLEKGTTSRLSMVPPSTSRGGPVKYRALPEPVLYPTEASLAAGVLGKMPCGKYRQGDQPSFRVSVVHGDLRYARYPIMVGHYEGDTIIAAEAQIDALVHGALSQRYALGLYPGERGSVAVVLRKPTPMQQALALPSGAVVMGLGKWGELTAGQLGDLIRRAALQYLLELRNDLCGRSDAGDQSPAKVGLSILLVGGNSNANIAIGDSVAAILRAIAQVNRELANAEGAPNSIEEVEIIELYADTAIEAAHAVKRLAGVIGKELQTFIDAVPLLQRGREGRRRLMSTSGYDAWRRWEVSVVTPPSPPGPARLPKPLADRLKRAVVESGNADPELVAALAELAIGAQAGVAEAHREIRFLTLSDRARAEATSQQRQPELVERLIKDSISKPHFSLDESRVLFELTVPNELKSGLARVDNLVLVVDAESASYPWELMSAGETPLCIDKGLVRQLQTSSYRPQIGARAGTSAYVVGDPKVSAPYSPLAGAADEAVAVYGILKTKFEVKPPVPQPTALQVLTGLYERPYRIVHIAGHGQYEQPLTPGGKARCGVVLDNGVFLTAVEVGQMQQVPELVFLNCCYIGQTGPETAPRTSGVEFNRLAASVSRELIEMGVRAVVASGWAVDDAAAAHFAKTFYRKMIDDNETFGRALKAARVDTHDVFEDTNTWGAYQAYGDPDYRLDPTGGRSCAARLGHVDPAEFIEAVRDVARRSAVSSGSPNTPVGTLRELVADCPPDWLSRTDVLIDIGYAFGDLDDFETANRYLEAALAGDGTDSTTTMRAVERLADFEVRLADDCVNGKAGRAPALRTDAITRLDGLIALAPTAERYMQLADVYKRRAAAAPESDEVRKALSAAAENYRLAHQRNVNRQQFEPCPVLNWLAAVALLGNRVPDADILIDRCAVTASERFQKDRSFATAIGIAESALVRALASGVLGRGDAAADEFDRVTSAYKNAIGDSAPSPRERDAAGKQIDVAIAVLGKLAADDAATSETIVRLKQLRATITADVPVSI